MKAVIKVQNTGISVYLETTLNKTEIEQFNNLRGAKESHIY